MSRLGDFECITLRNGHRAVRHTVHGEVMHPSVGPWEEANALYVDQSPLRRLLCTPGDAPVCVFDIGLGAGANAVAALTAWAGLGEGVARGLHVYSFEVDLAPLWLALADPQGFPFIVPFAEAVTSVLDRGSWTKDGLRWDLRLGDVRETLPRVGTPADIVFHDPFSPDSNPLLWTRDYFARLRSQCRDTATLFTYSAATPTRTSLLAAGFFVGYGRAIGTKQETTVAALAPGALTSPLGPEWLTRWRRSSARAPHGEPLTAELEHAIESHPQFSRLPNS